MIVIMLTYKKIKTTATITMALECSNVQAVIRGGCKIQLVVWYG